MEIEKPVNVDCIARRRVELDGGKEVESQNWPAVVDGSPHAEELNIACRYAKSPTIEQQSHDLIARAKPAKDKQERANKKRFVDQVVWMA